MNKRANTQRAIALMKSQGLTELGKTAAKNKMTFSPAMDSSPLLKGKQSKLPDQIQAKILKGKMKKEQPIKDKMASAVSLIGLQYASNAMYANHVRKVTGQEKTANAFLRMMGAPSMKSWALRGGTVGGLTGGVGEATRLFNMAKSNKPSAIGMKSTKGLQADKEFLKRYRKMGGGKGTQGVLDFIKNNPAKALELAGPSLARNFAAGGAAGAGIGAAAARVGQGMAKRKAIETAKTLAVPAAIGAGGYALLS